MLLRHWKPSGSSFDECTAELGKVVVYEKTSYRTTAHLTSLKVHSVNFQTFIRHQTPVEQFHNIKNQKPLQMQRTVLGWRHRLLVDNTGGWNHAEYGAWGCLAFYLSVIILKNLYFYIHYFMKMKNSPRLVCDITVLKLYKLHVYCAFSLQNWWIVLTQTSLTYFLTYSAFLQFLTAGISLNLHSSFVLHQVQLILNLL